jgi:Outer membrane lipoprotein-sorting protein
MHISKISFVGFIICFAGLPLFAQQRALTAPEIATLKEKTAMNARSLQSLESNFKQTKQLSYLEDAVQSAGKLYFKNPKKIRWEYTTPTPFVIQFNGDKMYTRDGKGRISQTDLAANRRFNALNELLTETVQEGNFFNESRFGISYYRNGKEYVAALIPKEKALSKYIKQIELSIDGISFLVKKVKIIDPSSDYTQLDFTNQRKNIPISDDKFVVN